MDTWIWRQLAAVRIVAATAVRIRGRGPPQPQKLAVQHHNELGRCFLPGQERWDRDITELMFDAVLRCSTVEYYTGLLADPGSGCGRWTRTGLP